MISQYIFYNSLSTLIPFSFTILPGTPTTVQFGGTSFKTTEDAPTILLSPIVTSPIILAPEEIITLFCRVGCLLTLCSPVQQPPNVTP